MRRFNPNPNVRKNIKPGMNVPAGLSPELEKFLQSVKEHLQGADGARGQPTERFVTLQDLEKVGLINTGVLNGRGVITKLNVETTDSRNTSGTITDLTDLGDVSVGGADDLDFLVYRAGPGEWVPYGLFHEDNAWYGQQVLASTEAEQLAVGKNGTQAYVTLSRGDEDPDAAAMRFYGSDDILQSVIGVASDTDGITDGTDAGDTVLYPIDGRVVIPFPGTAITVTWDTTTQASGHFTLSNGDCTLLRTSLNNSAWRSIRGNLGKSSGKWYWEFRYDTDGGGAAPLNDFVLGVARSTLSSTSYVGSDANSYGLQDSNVGVLKYNNSGSTFVATGGNAAGTIFMCALDMDSGKVWFGFNGSWLGAGNPAAGTNAAFTGLSGTMYPAAGMFTAGRQGTARFASSAFTYTPPTGFSALSGTTAASLYVFAEDEATFTIGGTRAAVFTATEVEFNVPADLNSTLDVAGQAVFDSNAKFSAAQAIEVESTTPSVLFDETDAASNERQWRIVSNGGLFAVQTYSDAGSLGISAILIDRTGTTVDEVELNATTFDFNGNLDLSGTSLFTGAAKFAAATTAVELESTSPRLLFDETDGASDKRLVDAIYSGSVFSLRTRTDADGAGITFLSMTRGTGTNVTRIDFTQQDGTSAVTYTLLGGNSFLQGSVGAGAVGMSVINNNAAADSRGQITVASDGGTHELGLQMYAAATSSAPVTGGPTGAQGLIRTFSTEPLVFAVNGTQRMRLSTAEMQVSVSGLFTNATTALELESASPVFLFDETDAASDERQWRWSSVAGVLRLDTYTDAGALGNNAIAIDRTGTAVAEIELNATLHDINGAIDVSGDAFFTGDFEIYCGVGAAHITVVDTTGVITITAGNPAAGSTGDGATATLQGGLGGFTSGYGGSAQVRGGDSSGVHPAGVAQLLGGKSYGSANGGDVGFTGGESTSGSGGSGFFYGGTGGGVDGDLYFGSHAGTNTAFKITGATLVSTFFFETRFADGNAGTPTISFTSDTNSGVYWIAADNFGFSAGGTLRFDVSTARVNFDIPIQLQSYTVATLPAGTQGFMAYVTDALAPTWGATVAGTGAVVVPVFYDGTNWIVV